MGHSVNDEFIEKAITTSDLLNGGRLNAEQQARFIVLVKRFSTLLPMTRFVTLSHSTMDVDKLHIGEPVTESADENTDSANQVQAKFNKVPINAKKLRSQWQISTETLQDNIEQNDFEDTLMQAITERIATDLELLAIQGDVATFTAGTDPTSRLLKRLDGWDVQTEETHVIDVQGASIQKGIWSEAKRTLPKQFKNDPGLRWLVSDTIATDWMDTLSDRATGIGDAALQGSGIAPFGIPMVIVNLIPDDQPITVTGASSAQVIGTEFGPYVITAGVNNKLLIDVDNAGAVAITLVAGTREVVVVANEINTQLIAGGAAAIATDSGDGLLLLKSPTTGAASEVDIQATANDAYTTLGLTVAVTPGAASGGSVLEGSFILLTNPRNLIWAILDGTRIFTEFNKNFDRIESVIFNQVDAKIENVDAIVKIKNIRRKTLIL